MADMDHAGFPCMIPRADEEKTPEYRQWEADVKERAAAERRLADEGGDSR
jgi:hypothetical protein